MKKVLLIIFCLVQISYSQISNIDYVKKVVPKAIEYKKSKVILGVGLLSAGGLLLIDNEINNWIQENPILPDNVSHIGDKWISSYAFVGVSFAGAIFKGHQNDNYIEPIRFLIVSNAVNYGLTKTIKVGFNRKRPNGDIYSFPSAHTSIAFTTATVFQKWYGYKIGIPAYAMAIITALSRMNDNKHYASDVAFGTALGIAVPTAFYETEKICNKNLNISLNLNGIDFEYWF
ncbi:MAG: phosphatase PAP2 family protein [Candidatus Marinimicrobia bacterium]|nr:phosphatase PAP2 family protein [Candidatus Neomarinimicrobiota bacterium]